MAGGEERNPLEYWDPEKMLDLYIHDYLVKRNFRESAALFAQETNVSQHRVEIDTPEGFLREWWSIFYDVYSASAQTNNGDIAESSSAAPRRLGDELQNIYPPERKRQRIGQSPLGTDATAMLVQPTASSVLPIDFRSDMQRLDYERRAHIRPSASNASHQQLQVFNRPQQQHMQIYNRPQQQDARVSSGVRFSVPVDSTPHGAINRRPAHLNAGNNSGVSPMPLQGWTLTGVGSGPVSSGMGPEVLNNTNFLHQQQQIQALVNYPQTALMPTSSHKLSDLREVEVQMMNNPKTQTAEKEVVVLSRKSTQQQDDELQKLHEDIREIMSMPNKSNVAGGESIVMMTPTTQTASKQAVVPTRENTQQHQQDDQQQQLHKNTTMTTSKSNKSNAAGGESSVGAADADADADAEVEVDKQVDENIESYLSHNEDNAEITSNTLSTLQPLSLDSKNNEPKGFSFKEVGSAHPSNTKVLCCNLSSDGKFLASGGHEKKVFMWNVDTFQLAKTDEAHSHIITDVRFRPNSTVFATSSFDRTVQLWDATRSSKPLLKLEGHGEQVISLDFHPKNTDLLCSCDSNDEIRLWNVNNRSPFARSFKGANRQVRFQPQFGNFLAAASGSTINLIDVETSHILHKFEGHSKDIHSLCWDMYGNQIASVCEDSARLWCVRSGKCEQELKSNGNKFESCAFHPGYSQLLVIGSYQSLVLWNAKENNKTATIHAHEGIISSVADSPLTGMIASASHDQWVKLWK